MNAIRNRMVEDGEAFPQEEALDKASGAAFFAAQTYTVAAEETATGRVPGYMHSAPNNICPCGGKQHACAASLRAVGLCAAGRAPGGFRLRDGHCEDICPFFHLL